MLVVKNNLRVLMAQHRLRVEDVHEKTGLSPTTISKIKNETSTKIGLETIAKLCQMFNCGVDDLFYLEEVEDPEDKEERQLQPAASS